MQNPKESFPQLNLPAADLRLLTEAATMRPVVFDPLRRKIVALTPEEWVRQHFVNYLAEKLGYPRSLMANEVALTLNSTDRRADTVVYDRKARPLMIVEYKAPDIPITEKVFEQAVRYNITLRARYLTLSNGMQHVCCRLADGDRPACFLPSIPPYDEL